MYRLKDLVCEKCGHEWEDLVDNEEELICPKCGEKALLQPDFTKRVNRPGAYYKSISWSLHGAGQ